MDIPFFLLKIRNPSLEPSCICVYIYFSVLTLLSSFGTACVSLVVECHQVVLCMPSIHTLTHAHKYTDWTTVSVQSGYEQAFVERSGLSTQDQVLHSSESPATYIRCLCQWEEATLGHGTEVLNTIIKGRLWFGRHSRADNATDCYKKHHWD